MFNKNYKNRRYWYKSRFISFIIFIIDIIGYSITGFKKNYVNIALIKKIGIIVTDHIGDAILSTPIFKILKKHYPNIDIILICTNYNSIVFQNSPYIDETVVLSNSIYSRRISFQKKIIGFYKYYKIMKNLKLDAMVDSRGDFVSIILMFLAGIKQRIGFNIGGFGFLLSYIIKFKFNSDYIKNFATLNKTKFLREIFHINECDIKPEIFIPQYNAFTNFKKNSYIIIHPGGGENINNINQIPPELFHKIIDFLIQNTDFDIIVTGKKEELSLTIPYNKRIKNYIGKTNFIEFANLIRKAKFIISGSTSAIHIAYAYDVPVFVIFSMRDSPFLWFYRTSQNMMIFNFTECALCEKNFCIKKECLKFDDNFLFSKLTRFINEKIKYRVRV